MERMRTERAAGCHERGKKAQTLNDDATNPQSSAHDGYISFAVDAQGNPLEFHLSITRDAPAAKRFFAKALEASHTVIPRVITVDKNAVYPKAIKELKTAGILAAACELRQNKYLTNLIEQDHRFLKRLVKPGRGFFSFETAKRRYKDMR